MDERTRQATRLWTLAQPAVSAFITSVVRDFKDRDDVLQDVAVAVIESFDRYDPQRPFTAWAIGVARNQVGLYLKKRRRHRLVFGDSVVNSLADAFSEISAEPAREEALRECMQMLAGHSRRLCEMRYRDDLKPAAIGESLGMAANAVAKALQRIRDQLRACVDRKMIAEGRG
jgi:RNA polymerase sigma-70 factor (ECF subfamily)